MGSLNISTASIDNQTAPSKVALVAEGGGQRGIFTAGVLDAWLDQEYDPFDLFIGTSAGSQNLTSYLARQKGYAKRLIRGLSRNKRFFQLGRGLVGKHIVDLDWYFDKTTEVKRALDFKTAKSSLGNRELLITATNSRDRQPYFLTPTGERQQWLELLKASSALPFLYKQGVKLTPLLNEGTTNEVQPVTVPKNKTEEDFYVDGGLAAPLPIREAYNRGARKIVVIRTVDADYQAQSVWGQKLRSFACASGYCPKTLDYLLQHEQAYLEELEFIANPPENVEIKQIFASEKLHSKLLGSSNNDLRFDHKLGLQAGRSYLSS
ncbi:MAG: patatin-like phospholipase family protein [Pseudoalteromonas sp.]|uniref:patatin-like phospholipase family protein n=1 Tax=unclassified Pseudoalteromonas TaxID=194690 RepID=UPI003F97A0EA